MNQASLYNKIFPLALKGNSISRISKKLNVKKTDVRNFLDRMLVGGKSLLDHHKQAVFGMLKHLQSLAIIKGRHPRAEDIKRGGKYSVAQYKMVFKSIPQACRIAGLDKNYLIDNPKIKKIRSRLKWHPEIILKKLKRKKEKRTRAGTYNADELLEYLVRLSLKLGRTPRLHDVHDEGVIPMSAYYKIFGSFINAQHKAGLKPSKISGSSKRIPFAVSPRQLIKHLRLSTSKPGGFLQ